MSVDKRQFFVCQIVPVLPPKLRITSEKLVTSLQVISKKDIEAGIGAPMVALSIAKEMAPLGKPDFPRIMNEGTSLGVWNKIHGKAATAKFIMLFMISLNKYFNVVRPMSMGQMEELSIEFAEYTMYTFEDFIAFFEAIKRQRLGDVRDRLDPATMWEMFRKYDAQRDEFFERRAREKHEHPEKSIPNNAVLATRKTDSVVGAFMNLKKQISDGRQQ